MAVAANQQVKEREYWLNQLAGELVKSRFPYDFQENHETERQKMVERFIIKKDIFAQLMRICRGNDFILHITLTANLMALLYKYSGTPDIIIGIPVHIQQFDREPINIALPIRSYLHDGPTFKELLIRERMNIIEAEEHRNYPVEILAEQLGFPVGDETFSLFETVLLLENIHNKTLLRHLQLNMVFSFIRTETGLEGMVEYNTALYRPSTIRQIIGHFSNLLESALSNLDARLEDIDILSKEEKSRLLREFNDTETAYPKDTPIHRLFSEQAEKTPDDMAIIFEDQHITYRELERRADALALLLKEKGVARNTIAGLMMERSIEMIAGMLAILKAGGAYLPLASDFPLIRTLYMLGDSNAAVLLTRAELICGDEFDYNGEIIDISSLQFIERNTELVENINDASDLAYVIYTSGTTGRPKGVMIEHRNVVNFMKGIAATIGFRPGEAILAATTITFDISVLELLMPLTTGLKVVMANDRQRQEPEQLERLIIEKRVDILQLTPSGLSVLLEGTRNTAFLKGVSRLLVGGEHFPTHLFQRLNVVYPGPIYNVYGPTETTIWSTLRDLTSQRDGDIDIGSPLANTQVYILNAKQQLIPIGAVGELCIGGDGVARGYINRPELTAEIFLEAKELTLYPSQDSHYITKHIYRTGDLARWLPDGNIQLLGRIDHQVKIRGFRIELGEIENHLLTYDIVQNTVVIAIEDNNGDKSLCAYIATRNNGEFSTSALREHLADNLPDYMIPSYFVLLDHIPLTVNGKVDRKALPRPDLSGESRDIVKPRNDIEEAVVQIWAEVLGVENSVVSIDDNFFHLGGNSLTVALLAAIIHNRLWVRVKLVDIFTHPTVREFSHLIKNLEREACPSISPAPRKSYYPLSSAQQRLYILREVDEQGTSYNMPLFAVLQGNLDTMRFENTIKSLIRRHESFRTSFQTIEGTPVQTIADDVPFKIEYHQVENWGGEEPIINEFVRPFDLTCAPLLRVGLIHVESSHILMVDMHHIIADGTSLQIFKQEFLTLYGGHSLPALSVQYKDYAHWQAVDRDNAVQQKQQKYWLEHLDCEIPVLTLPTDYPRPVSQSFEGRVEHFEISAKDTALLKAITPDEGVTLYMTLLAVLDIFLTKITAQKEIIVGTPAADRRHHQLQGIIGMFANTLVMHSRPLSDKRFTEFLQEIKNDTLDALENQDYQFGELVEQLTKKKRLNRDTSRNPLFDVMFVHQDADLAEETIPGLKLLPYNYENRTTKFDLTFHAVESGEKILFNLEYSTALFKRETILRFIDYFKQIVDIVTGDPTIEIGDIEIIGEREKKEILAMSRGDRCNAHPPLTVHRLFERKALEMGENHALVFDGAALSYRELDQAANHLSARLRTRGVRPGTIVGLMLPRSFLVVTGILAILKAGAAYLPIDPDLPAGRKKYMLQNAGTCHLLTTSQIGDTMDWFPEGMGIIDATADTETGTADSDYSPAPDVKGSDLAYVIYTSGSHGRPKGVMMEHRSLVNLICYHLQHTAIDFSGVLQYASASFDVSFQEIFTTLLAGGTLYLVANESRLNPPVLFDLVKKHDIKTLFLPAALLRELFKEVSNISFLPSNITHIISSGEKLVVHDGLRHYLQENNIHLHNHYGPTETHVVTSLTLSPDEDIPLFPTIGRPVFNTNVYILDNRLKLQPVGIPGEIYIAGSQVSRGYVNDPELTAQRFQQDPFYPTQSYRLESHARLYRTGDIGRRLADGSIRFLGRIDNQIKIRGYRVELEEIQRHILAVDGVSDAVVVCPDGGDGNLYAYIVAQEELDLHNPLVQHLPSYMLPTAFIKVDKIPLTSHGKPDLDILPSPDNIAFTGLNNYIAPRTPFEKKLQGIWRKVLNCPPDELISIDADFFRLGGNSLRGMKLLALVYIEFRVKLPMADIFKNPSIRWLATAIEQASEKEDIPLELVPEKNAYQMSSAQYRLHSLHQRGIDNTGYNIPIFVTLEGDVDKVRLEHAFDALLMRHESLRTSFYYDKDKKQTMQRIHPQVPFAMEYHDITENNADAPVNETDIIKQFIKPFDLKLPPLMRAGLVKLTEKKHLLMIDIHHITMDFIALTIFMEDLGRLYKEETLIPQRYHYKEYSEKQNRIKETEKIKKQREYWLEQFAGEEIPSVDLPLDHGRPMVQSFAGGLVEGVLDSEEVRALNKLRAREDVLLSTLSLALFNVLLAKICSQEDIVVGIPHTDFSDCLRYRIIGVFVNSLPLRNRPEPGKHFSDFLKEVKVSKILALENADYQYDDLVEQLAISNDFSRNPLFSTMFLYQDPVPLAVEVPDLRIYPHNYNHHSAKLDLTLHVIEEEDRLRLRFEYCTKLFKEETIYRFKEYFKNIVTAVIKNPRIKIADIDVYSTPEKNRLLYEFNETDVQYPNHYTIHQLFEEQVKRAPHNTAVFFKGKAVSYCRLNKSANQLAGILRKNGAKPGTIHAIMADRSVEMIIGILAILKAGGAYLPIEFLHYPKRRVLQILRDSAVHSVLTDGSASVSPAIEKMAPIIYIKDLLTTLSETFDLVNINSPGDLAYVIYTSGAMGRPKGIMVEHQSVINLVLGLKDRVFSQYRGPLKFCLVASYMFDASVQQIFGALLAGHSLDIVPEPHRKNGSRLLTFYNKHRIDISDGTPHHLRLLLQGLSGRGRGGGIAVKHFLIGGEALPKNLVKQFFDRFDGKTPRITNVYGPAECCVDTTSFQLAKDRLHTLSTIPIGTPLPNCRVYIVNEANRPQPIGVPGELCISGAGMARGYLNLPELTAKKFIRNGGEKPFYRTGDRARWLSDGNIEFLGRIDQQVKLKGFRIELEEIENHLCSHSEISVAAVSVKEFTGEMRCADELTNKFLCAYYQARRELKKWKLQTFLSKMLPAYMIPTYFMRMKEIPILKPNYKIDRGSLPEVTFKPEPYVAPENKTQEKLKEILEDALEIEPISIYDSIFDLGAHSLKATAITSLISMEFQIAIDIIEIYENPTISQLATIISDRQSLLRPSI
jgi:tyrocidine synthetase-3